MNSNTRVGARLPRPAALDARSPRNDGVRPTKSNQNCTLPSPLVREGRGVRGLLQADLFEGLRQLERLTRNITILPDKARHFAARDIAHIQQDAADHNAYTVYQTVIGLTGAQGILPDHFAELILERNRDKDKSFEAFLTIFDAHMGRLYYDSWKQARAFIQHEQAPDSRQSLHTQQTNTFSIALSHSGFSAIETQQHNLEALLYYSGLFAAKTRPLQHLETLLTDYFNVPVRIQTFDSQWTETPQSTQTQLLPQQTHTLGQGLLIGQRIHLGQHRFVIQIGPLRYTQYQQFLPDKPTLQTMQALVRAFVGSDYAFSIECTLHSTDIPKLHLRTATHRFCLGWNSWLKPRSALPSPLAGGGSGVRGKPQPSISKFGYSTLWKHYR